MSHDPERSLGADNRARWIAKHGALPVPPEAEVQTVDLPALASSPGSSGGPMSSAVGARRKAVRKGAVAIGILVAGVATFGLIFWMLPKVGADRSALDYSPPTAPSLATSSDVTAADPLRVDESALPDEPQAALGSSEAFNSDRLTTYAVVLGRASGCGVNITREGKQVGAWLNRNTSGADQDAMNMLFMGGIMESRDAQMAGRSLDDCEQVRTSFSRFNWP